MIFLFQQDEKTTIPFNYITFANMKNICHKTLWLSLLLTVTHTITKGQTNISGGIYSNTTWTKSNSPYIVTASIVVFDGVILTIEPGVQIKFNEGTGLELRGKLIAIGSPDDSITFTSNLTSPVPSSWKGIKVVSTTDPSGQGNQVIMEYCSGAYAHYFIDLDYAYHGPYIFRNCHFANNFQVNKDGGAPSTIFEHCRFESNNTALGWCQFDSRVSNSSFINNVNGVEGISIVESCFFYGNTGIALSPYGATVGCTIENNNIGVSCPFNSVNNKFTNNIVSNNSIGVEILSYFNNGITFTENTICNNSTYNVKLLHNNNADLSSNCWCSTDSSLIRSGIYDGYTDVSSGLVNFTPFKTSCEQTTHIGRYNISGNSDIPAEVYPNPFGDKLTFSLADNQEATIVLYDFLGRQVLRQTFINCAAINTGHLADGVYFYELKNVKRANRTGKVIKR